MLQLLLNQNFGQFAFINFFMRQTGG